PAREAQQSRGVSLEELFRPADAPPADPSEETPVVTQTACQAVTLDKERRSSRGKVSAGPACSIRVYWPRVAFKIVDFAIQLSVILFAISFHESAHAYAALRFGDTTARDLGRISLNPLRHLDPFGSVLLPALMYILSAGRLIFGSAKPTPVDLRNTRNPRLANLVVSAAGPVSNFLLSALALAVLLAIKHANPRSIVDLYLATEGQRFARGA